MPNKTEADQYVAMLEAVQKAWAAYEALDRIATMQEAPAELLPRLKTIRGYAKYVYERSYKIRSDWSKRDPHPFDQIQTGESSK